MVKVAEQPVDDILVHYDDEETRNTLGEPGSPDEMLPKALS
jgi:hypothetical protein